MPGTVPAFKPHITLWIVATIINLILRWGNWASEKLSNLSKITEQGQGLVGGLELRLTLLPSTRSMVVVGGPCLVLESSQAMHPALFLVSKVRSPLLWEHTFLTFYCVPDTCLQSGFFSGHLLCLGRPVLYLKNSPSGNCQKLKSLKGKCFSLVNKSHRPGHCEHKWDCFEKILTFLCGSW